MAQPFSEDLRERVVTAVERGACRRAVAAQFSVAPSTVTKWVQRQRRTVSLAPARLGGDRRSQRIEAHADEIKKLVAATPDITIEEIAAHLKAAHAKTFVRSTIRRCVDRHDLNQKNGARQRAGARRRGGRTPGLDRRSA